MNLPFDPKIKGNEMKKIIAFIFIAMLIVVVTLSMGGCGYRGYIIVRDDKADVVSVKKQGIIHKKDITGKGVDFYANKEMDFEYSEDKDGKKTYKFSSKKDSWVTKLLGGWKIVKPDNVEVGK